MPPRGIQTGGALFLLYASACVISEPDPTQFSCPCDEQRDWYCDTAVNRCVQGEPPHCGVPGAEPGTIIVEDFRPEWSTAESIRWSFTPAADLDKVAGYVLVVAPTRGGLVTGINAVTLDDSTDPGLSGDVDTRFFIADSHPLEPETVYFARLLARDFEGRVSCSGVVEAVTGPPADQESLFFEDEDPAFGCVCPPFRREAMEETECETEFRPDAGNSYRGSAHLAMRMRCRNFDSGVRAVCYDVPADLTVDECFENLQLGGIDVPLGELLPRDFETTAFVEFAIRVDDSEAASYGEVRILPAGGGAAISPGFSIPASGQYRVFQLPLRFFRLGRDGSSGPLVWADLVGGYTKFQVGGSFTHLATVRVDSVRIRW